MGRPVKIVYIVSDINKALSFEWITQYLNRELFVLSFILLNPGDSELEQFLKKKHIKVSRVVCRGKKDWLPSLIKTFRILKEIGPTVVHCHLIQANLIGLIAARLAGVSQRIYTRHHSSLHHVYFKKGIFWDKLANRLATKVVAISGIVKRILLEWEQVAPEKVVLIPHGFLLDEFNIVNEKRIADFKDKYGLSGRGPVIGVISRFTEWKGVQYIIPAFRKLIVKYPESVLMMLNAQGDYEAVLLKQLEELESCNYRLIKFEKDIAAAYKCMDVFVHVPIDEHSEAFGQIYIEALAAGVPSIFTRSGIANEEHFNQDVAFIAEHKNSDQILQGIEYLLENKEEAKVKVEAGKSLVRQYELPVYIQQLEQIYLDS